MTVIIIQFNLMSLVEENYFFKDGWKTCIFNIYDQFSKWLDKYVYIFSYKSNVSNDRLWLFSYVESNIPYICHYIDEFEKNFHAIIEFLCRISDFDWYWSNVKMVWVLGSIFNQSC